jgi:hypothetical protein
VCTEPDARDSLLQQHIDDLCSQAEDELHRTLLAACTGEAPVRSMEEALGEVLLGVLRDED